MSVVSDAYHQQACSDAMHIYIAGLAPAPLADEWRQVARGVRKDILRALYATNFLRDIYGALTKSGRHLLVLRHLFAPPISQDQLRLVAPLYPKSSEKTWNRLSTAAAHEFANAFQARRDVFLTPWLTDNANPTRRQIKRIIDTLTPMISSQIFNTLRRNRLSDEQEAAVEAMLCIKGWPRVASAPVASPAGIAPAHYMRKTRCVASASAATKEVDIACGIRADLILAMECKVSNDATNSVKRVSDVLDKAKSWQTHWGHFIQTAALLQGVISYKDVARLLEANVRVFWSHDLQALSNWLDANS